MDSTQSTQEERGEQQLRGIRMKKREKYEAEYPLIHMDTSNIVCMGSQPPNSGFAPWYATDTSPSDGQKQMPPPKNKNKPRQATDMRSPDGQKQMPPPKNENKPRQATNINSSDGKHWMPVAGPLSVETRVFYLEQKYDASTALLESTEWDHIRFEDLEKEFKKLLQSHEELQMKANTSRLERRLIQAIDFSETRYQVLHKNDRFIAQSYNELVKNYNNLSKEFERTSETVAVLKHQMEMSVKAKDFERTSETVAVLEHQMKMKVKAKEMTAEQKVLVPYTWLLSALIFLLITAVLVQFL